MTAVKVQGKSVKSIVPVYVLIENDLLEVMDTIIEIRPSTERHSKYLFAR